MYANEKKEMIINTKTTTTTTTNTNTTTNIFNF